MSKIQTKEHLGIIVSHTKRLLSQNIQNELNCFEPRITVEQWHLLIELLIEDDISQTQLGERTFRDKPTTTRILKLLIDQGLIQRQNDPVDRRAYRIFLTEEGRLLAQDSIEVVKKVIRKAQTGLSFQEISKLKRMLRIVNKNLSS